MIRERLDLIALSAAEGKKLAQGEVTNTKIFDKIHAALYAELEWVRQRVPVRNCLCSWTPPEGAEASQSALKGMILPPAKPEREIFRVEDFQVRKNVKIGSPNFTICELLVLTTL